MSTAVVVATVVTTEKSESNLTDHLLDQIRINDRELLSKLSREGSEARVVSAILDVEEFLDYARERAGSAAANGAGRQGSATRVATAGMSELEFMEHTLQQMRAGENRPAIALDEEDVEAMDDEAIGRDESIFPFRY